ncbi:hypothetical protein K458DRAFT_396343 [Lentithecium fluviatile CBS 122367]|uniref:Uncharacterized protein n=1 Tax=Lentithecium fluviatile CBS 122367 TaxID=1168545 RepID=A0A6G1IG25_9PLEO|nr:hypothetical protein K458DRAFT_396343 [Lentithecium fluviatile CBS 122367]
MDDPGTEKVADTTASKEEVEKPIIDVTQLIEEDEKLREKVAAIEQKTSVEIINEEKVLLLGASQSALTILPGPSFDEATGEDAEGVKKRLQKAIQELIDRETARANATKLELQALKEQMERYETLTERKEVLPLAAGSDNGHEAEPTPEEMQPYIENRVREIRLNDFYITDSWRDRKNYPSTLAVIDVPLGGPRKDDTDDTECRK